MEDILYVKAEQNVAVKKKDLQIKDVATLYSSNTAMVQKLEKEPFYTLPGDSKILTMFTVTKIYEAVHKFRLRIWERRILSWNTNRKRKRKNGWNV